VWQHLGRVGRKSLSFSLSVELHV
ncbi:IS1 family transposase, partial [Escherichia coli]|nr:IS1 family transposase [Escherichia coli]